jgi:hypothetical protein
MNLLFQQLQEANQAKYEIVQESVFPIHDKSLIPIGKHLGKSAFDPKVLLEIEKSRSFVHVILSCSFSTIHLYYVFAAPKEDLLLPKLKKEVTLRVAVLFHFLKRFMRSEFPKELFVYFYFTSLKKLLPTRKTTLGWYDVNTGLTERNSNEIAIYREEEFFKVLIHECFHCLGLDFPEWNTEVENASLKQVFKIEPTILLSESYAEFFANILNLLFLSNYNASTFYKLLSKEKEFKMFQMVKVLHYMDMTYNDLFTEHGKKFEENTNVFAYYILCNILIFFAEEFLAVCEKENVENLLQSNQSEESSHMVISFLKKYCQNNKFLNQVARQEKILKRKHSKTRKGKILSTLRMTIFE